MNRCEQVKVTSCMVRKAYSKNNHLICSRVSEVVMITRIYVSDQNEGSIFVSEVVECVWLVLGKPCNE